MADGSDEELCSPVTALKDGFTVHDLIKKNETEFEIMPDEEEFEPFDGKLPPTSTEAVLDFESMQKFINLDVTDFDENDGEDSSPFDKYRRKMLPIDDEGKVLKYIIRQGVGPVVPLNATVYINYQAYLEYQEVPFDCTTVHNLNSDRRRDDPKPISLARDSVIPGLHRGLLTMQKGEKAEFLIHPDLAFGKLGCPPRIPAEAFVLFIVELDRFVDCGDAFKDHDDLDMEERLQFKNIVGKAKALHLLGSDLFKNGKYPAAAARYKQAVNMLHNARLENEKEENDRNHLLLKLYANMCICYHKLGNYKRVCCMAADAMKTSEKLARQHFKLLYFWGYAKMMLGDYDGAAAHLKASKNLCPHDPTVNEALAILMKKKQDAKEAEKQMYQRAFNQKPPASVKITEVSEEEEELRKTIKTQLEEFKNCDQECYKLQDQVSKNDERIWLEVATELGLYARVASGTSRIIHIRKP